MANEMIENYYVHVGHPNDRVYRKDLETFPFVIIRCTHGHGEGMRPILDNLQVPLTQQILDSAAGLFHATKVSALKPIFQTGILPMGRVASMFSIFYHLDENCRNVGMQ
eukprot:9400522-Lingulodinium_polyedra.AAC.1